MGKHRHLRSPAITHDDARKKAPPRGEAFFLSRKVNDEAQASGAWMVASHAAWSISAGLG